MVWRLMHFNEKKPVFQGKTGTPQIIRLENRLVFRAGLSISLNQKKSESP